MKQPKLSFFSKFEQVKIITTWMLKTAVVFTFLLLVSASYAQPPSHDPSTMIRNVDGRYWIFTTGKGVWCMSSSNANFTDWRAEPTPFGNSWPSWINNYVSGFSGDFWAPEVYYMNSKYYLYYSCSSFGSKNSAIGVATATNLAGPWTDQGMVVYSNSSTSENAIDPAIFKDGNNLWLVYGSFFGGIRLAQLSTSTGKPLNSTRYALASGDCEAPYIMKNGSYYYLFINRGSCCKGVNSTYYVQVGRSTSITGPYLDKQGRNLNNGYGTTFISSEGRYIGPGCVGFGEGRFTYHYYDGQDNGNAKLRIRTDFNWGSDGWPIFGTAPTGPVVSGQSYRITPRHSGKTLDVQNCGTANGTNVQQWSWLNNDCQSWRFTDVGSGYWRISPLNATARALRANGTANGSNVTIQDYSNTTDRQWQLVDMGGGYYQIRARNSNRCLDIYNFSTADGANAIVWDCSSSSQNQQFQFTHLMGKSAEVALSSEDMTIGEIRIYPNPVSEGRVTIELTGLEGTSVLRLIDMNGRLIKEQTTINTPLVEMQLEVQQGLYLMQILNGEQTINRKISVIR